MHLLIRKAETNQVEDHSASLQPGRGSLPTGRKTDAENADANFASRGRRPSRRRGLCGCGVPPINQVDRLLYMQLLSVCQRNPTARAILPS